MFLCKNDTSLHFLFVALTFNRKWISSAIKWSITAGSPLFTDHLSIVRNSMTHLAHETELENKSLVSFKQLSGLQSTE